LSEREFKIASPEFQNTVLGEKGMSAIQQILEKKTEEVAA
jgi:hypothetical protein